MSTGSTPSLFPNLPVRAKRSNPMTGSADCKQVCRCDDGCDYAIKEAAVLPTMPHNEWFCAKLAERVGIGTPTCRIVDVQGIECFGSRWEAGEESDWWNRAFAGPISFPDLAPGISRVFAFDLFVHNEDRHLNNYFVQKQRIGYAVLAMDFGRAWLFSGMPPPPLPMAPAANTIGDLRKLLRLFGPFIDSAETDDVCDRLATVTDSEVAGIIASHPSVWINTAQKDQILSWWRSPERQNRITTIRNGIKDGSLL
jgi:hypothetical protein